MTLEFNFRPTLSAYLYLAYVFGILEKRKVPGQLLNWNIQLLFQNNREGRDVLALDLYPDFRFPQYKKMGLFEGGMFFNHRRRPDSPGHFRDSVLDFMRRGHFAYLFVDYFEIPNTIAFQKFHFRHDLLLYGASEKKRLFEAAIFSARGRFERTTVSFDQLFAAYTSPGGRGAECWHYCRRDMLSFYRPNHIACRAGRLEVNQIRRQLSWYLDKNTMFADLFGRDKKRKFHRHHFLAGRNLCFGREIYAGIAASLKRAIDSGRTSLDPRITRLLWEHKKLMRLRLERLMECGARVGPQLDAWGEVENAAHALHLRVVRFGSSKEPPALKPLLEPLRVMGRREPDILASVRASL